MRRRRRHAFLAVLVALFALPVIKPEGFPGLEGWFDGAIHWTARLGFSSPKASDLAATGSDADAVRARDLAVINLAQREEFYGFVEETNQRAELHDALRSLDRLPLALAARVLRAHDASSLRRSILIDRGAADGLVEGLAVAQGRVFIGIVQRVDAHSSRVQLVTDAYARLAVAVRTREGARATAWLWGASNDAPMPLRLLRAADGMHVRADDAVLTSNDNELVPAGLVVGRVVSASDADADSLVDVRIRPLFDLDRTTTVLVLVPPK
jgi:cell shape-determining protein MreC